MHATSPLGAAVVKVPGTGVRPFFNGHLKQEVGHHFMAFGIGGNSTKHGSGYYALIKAALPLVSQTTRLLDLLFYTNSAPPTSRATTTRPTQPPTAKPGRRGGGLGAYRITTPCAVASAWP